MPSSDEECTGIIASLAIFYHVKLRKTVKTKLDNRNSISVQCIETGTRDRDLT